MSGVAVREYASAEEMLAAYRARKRPPSPVVVLPQGRRFSAPVVPRRLPTAKWSDFEVMTLRRLVVQGCQLEEISVSVRRSIVAVIRKMKELGLSCVPRVRDQAFIDATKFYRLHFEQCGGSTKAGKILADVAEQHGFTVAEIRSPCRNLHLVAARKLAMYLCARDTLLSYPQLGRVFHRDHSTVIHAVRSENKRLGTSVRATGPHQ